MMLLRIAFCCFILVFSATAEDNDKLDGSFVTEQRGYFKREHSLVKPYQCGYSV